MSKLASADRTRIANWVTPRDRWISRIEWAAIVGIALVNVVLARRTGIALSEPLKDVELLAVVFAVWPLAAVLTRLTGFGVGAEVIAENAVKFFLFTLAASNFVLLSCDQSGAAQ